MATACTISSNTHVALFWFAFPWHREFASVHVFWAPEQISSHTFFLSINTLFLSIYCDCWCCHVVSYITMFIHECWVIARHEYSFINIICNVAVIWYCICMWLSFCSLIFTLSHAMPCCIVLFITMGLLRPSWINISFVRSFISPPSTSFSSLLLYHSMFTFV